MERNKTTKQIEVPHGKLLIFGGVYSNLQALGKMEEVADKLGITADRTICTGDVVGYCAQPEEVVQKTKDWGIHSIAGNVEIQLREGEEDCGCDFTDGGRCDSFSKQWYPYAQQKLSSTSIEWMKKLPDFIQFQFGSHRVLVVHGSYFYTSEFVFKSTPWTNKALNFSKSGSDVILAGHCGLPFNDSQGEKLWVNPGVIGMPANDATARVWYLLLDLDKENKLSFSHESFSYDHEMAADLMHRNHLTPEYAKTLKTGVWDNCEILPAIETSQQGQFLSF